MVDAITPFVRELGQTRQGTPVLIVHGGMSDESPWLPVGEVLAERLRVTLLRRRLYRLDLPVDVRTAMTEQAAEVLEVAAAFGEPCVVVGHSSGAIVALESLVADPDLFRAAVLYEPPSPLPGLPLGEPDTLSQARTALAQEHPGRALKIFLSEGARVPALASTLAPAMAVLPPVRRYIGRQIDDLDTILRLGDRSVAYAAIATPTWFLTGQRSSSHLQRRCESLTDLLPNGELVRLPRTGHGANQSHPRQLGELIADLVARC